MKTTDQQEKFIELRARNWSFDKIADKLNVSKPTLIDWSHEFNQKIGNFKAIELEALQEKYYMSKKAKIELYGEKLNAVKAELESRIDQDKLDELEIGELFELFMKLSTRLDEEKVAIKFQVDNDKDAFNELDNLLATETFTPA